MCLFVHWYGWGDGHVYTTLAEAKRHLYKKRVQMRRIMAESGGRVVRESPTAVEWENKNGSRHTVSIMRVPEGSRCPHGESLDPRVPYSVREVWVYKQLAQRAPVTGWVKGKVHNCVCHQEEEGRRG